MRANDKKDDIQIPVQKYSSHLPLASNLYFLVITMVSWAPLYCSLESRPQWLCKLGGGEVLKNAHWKKLPLVYMGVAHQVSSNPQLGDSALHTNTASCNQAFLIGTLWGGNGNMEIRPCTTSQWLAVSSCGISISHSPLHSTSKHALPPINSYWLWAQPTAPQTN